MERVVRSKKQLASRQQEVLGGFVRRAGGTSEVTIAQSPVACRSSCRSSSRGLRVVVKVVG